MNGRRPEACAPLPRSSSLRCLRCPARPHHSPPGAETPGPRPLPALGYHRKHRRLHNASAAPRRPVGQPAPRVNRADHPMAMTISRTDGPEDAPTDPRGYPGVGCHASGTTGRHATRGPSEKGAAPGHWGRARIPGSARRKTHRQRAAFQNAAASQRDAPGTAGKAGNGEHACVVGLHRSVARGAGLANNTATFLLPRRQRGMPAQIHRQAQQAVPAHALCPM